MRYEELDAMGDDEFEAFVKENETFTATATRLGITGPVLDACKAIDEQVRIVKNKKGSK